MVYENGCEPEGIWLVLYRLRNAGAYLNVFSDTYYGEAMAVIASEGSKEIRPHAISEAGENQLRIAVQ